MAASKRRRPIHPGEVLRTEFLDPMGITAAALARAIRVPPNRISQILAEKREVSAETALRLARYLGTTPEFWMGLQSSYALRCAELVLEASDLRRIKPYLNGYVAPRSGL